MIPCKIRGLTEREESELFTLESIKQAINQTFNNQLEEKRSDMMMEIGRLHDVYFFSKGRRPTTLRMGNIEYRELTEGRTSKVNFLGMRIERVYKHTWLEVV